MWFNLEFYAVFYILLLTLNNTCYIPCVPFFIERHPKIHKAFCALNNMIEVKIIYVIYIYIYIYSYVFDSTIFWVYAGNTHCWKTERHHIHKQHITNIMTSIRWNRVLQASGGLQCYDIHSSDSCYWHDVSFNFSIIAST